MKKDILNRFILFTLFLSIAGISRATHMMGIEMFYRWDHDSTYEFTLVLYRNCLPGTATVAPSYSIRVYAPSRGSTYQLGYSSFNVNLLPNNASTPPIEMNSVFNCINTTYCLEEYVYRGYWVSSGKAEDWRFATGICCIPPDVFNVSYNDMFIEAGLNNLHFPDSVYKVQSPVFHNRRPNHPGHLKDVVYNPAIYSTCEKKPVMLSQAARNYDGDTIRYSFTVPQGANGVPNSYINGFSFLNPLPTTAGIFIDSMTGMINFIPGAATVARHYVLGIQATTYDYDTTLVGGIPTPVLKEKSFVRRNLYVIIEDSAACSPEPVSYMDTLGRNPADTIVLGCSEDHFRVNFNPWVKCSSIDPDGSHADLKKASNSTSIHIVQTIPNQCSINETTDGFTVYLDSALEEGYYYLLFKTGNDGNSLISECGQELTPYNDTLVIRILEEKGDGQLIASQFAKPGDTLYARCMEKYLSVWVNEKFRCNSLANDGSDLRVYNLSTSPPAPEPIQGVHFQSCPGGINQWFTLEMQGSLYPGYYRLSLTNGKDNNSLLGYCSNNFDSTDLIVYARPTNVEIGPDLEFCEGTDWDTTLWVPDYFDKITWKDSKGWTIQTGRFCTFDTPGTYTIDVETNAHGGVCSDWDVFTITEKECFIGIDETDNDRLSISPNPATDKLHIGYNGKISGIRVTDMRGAVMKGIDLNNAQINISHLPNGVYFIQLTTEEATLTGRFIKN